jgi:hypothetical protein
MLHIRSSIGACQRMSERADHQEPWIQRSFSGGIPQCEENAPECLDDAPILSCTVNTVSGQSSWEDRFGQQLRLTLCQ